MLRPYNSNGRRRSDHLHPQQPTRPGGRPSHGAPARRGAGAAGPDRHQGGVRRGGVRRLHGADGWRAGPLLPGAAVPVRGRRIETVEGVAQGPAREFLERFVATGGVQCGACTPGIVVTAWALLERNPAPAARRRGKPWRATSAAARGTRGSCGRSAGSSGTGAVMIALRPRSLDEAVRSLAEDPALVLTAGCTDLMVRGPEALHGMDRVLDLLGIPELRGIREVDGGIEIGATATFTRSAARPRSAPPSRPSPRPPARSAAGRSRTAPRSGATWRTPAPRGIPCPSSSSWTPCRDRGGSGRDAGDPLRRVPHRLSQDGLQPGEIVVRVRIPYPPEGTVQAFRKVGTREAQAISKVVVALAGRVEDGRIADLRLAAGSVAATPVRLRAAEEAVRGLPAGPEAADLAGRAAAGEVEPIDDVRSTAEYRRFALDRVVRRMVSWRCPTEDRPMTTTSSETPTSLRRPLSIACGAANLEFTERYPGESGRRQPVHTVYGGAHLFKADTAARLGALALRALEEYAPDAGGFRRGARAAGADSRHGPRARGGEAAPRAGRGFPHRLRGRLRQPPRRGGGRPRRGRGAARWRPGWPRGTLPPFIGIRIKPFSEELRERRCARSTSS